MPAFTSSTFNRYAGKWLIVTGIFELALAAVFVVGGLLEPVLTGGFLLTAAGVFVLAWLTGPLATGVALATWLSYLIFYTPLKPLTSLSK